MKYSYRVRLAIVKRVKQGEAISHLSKVYSVSCNKTSDGTTMVNSLAETEQKANRKRTESGQKAKFGC